MFDYIERYGYCDECDAAQYRTGDLVGCSNPTCENYVSAQEHYGIG